jgi:uncharacterized protein (DUF1684 family)
MNPHLILDEHTAESFQLADYRRCVSDLYARVRTSTPFAGWENWRAGRDLLFANHPQSPIEPEDRDAFPGLDHHPYDPAYRVEAPLEPSDPWNGSIPHSADGTTPFFRAGRVDVDLPEGRVLLDVYWLDTYGGGLFLPFRDGTAGDTTYRGGRYLLDTAKGADLGSVGDRLVLDFNFAYHPSCAYSWRWSCPLAPADNQTTVPIRAGERLARRSAETAPTGSTPAHR